jgi:hypothetical protein
MPLEGPMLMSPIFLSYARIDNDKDEQDSHQGWVAYFHSRLRLVLNPKLGERLDFWRDVQEIEKGEGWHETIKEALHDAKVLLPVLSPAFLRSDNCQFELQHFLDCHKDSDSKALKESVIKIVKHQIDPSALPTVLREPEPFEFFIKDPEKGELSYYTPTTGLREDRKQAFMDELERLANRLAALLKEMHEVPAEPPVATVFLAIPYPGSALGELYHRAKAELERRKVKVIPDRKRFFADLDEPDPILLEQAVTNARLAVHLLDPTAGKEAMALAQRQIEATATRARDGTRLRRLIWLQEKPQGVPDNTLVTALRRLEANGGRLIEGDQLIEESSERFIDLMLRMLFPNDTISSPVIAPLYLLVHPDDDAVVRELILPALRSRGQRCRQPLPAALGTADRVGIYWGAKDAGWIFGEIDRLQGKGVGAILLIKGLPASAEKAAFLADEVAEIIDLAATPTSGVVV